MEHQRRAELRAGGRGPSALSDGVFAIALTLLVLTITTPELRGSQETLLGRELLARAPEFASYVISFAVLSLLWVRHHRFFRGLERIDARATALNLLYLGLVALLPYPPTSSASTAISRRRSSSMPPRSRSFRAGARANALPPCGRRRRATGPRHYLGG
jgi:uncharacterized membrane protein